MKNILTVGMAVHNDFKMLWATVQALKMEIVKYNLPVEILVVDNAPDTVDGKKTQTFLANHSGDIRCRYFVCPPELFGTTQPRQMVFNKSETEWTMCIDSHILLVPGALQELVRQLQGNTGEVHRDDLMSGPILMDDLVTASTHFDLIWDSEMWGKWGTAWWDHENGEYFSVIQHPIEDARCKFIKLSPEITEYNLGKKVLYYGHQSILEQLGYQTAIDRGYEFEIPAMGLGLFLARTESWLGFNPHMRGFGGEEGYIHTKYRNAGRRCICLPFLKWNHKFNGPEDINYSVDRRNKVRNYVLAFNEVGLPLDSIYNHFVSNKLLPETEWQKIVDDPVGYKARNTASPKEMLEKKQSEQRIVTMPDLNTCVVHDLYNYYSNVPRDLDKHFPTLKMVAERSNSVVEFTHRRESTIAFLAGGPSLLVSYQSELDDVTNSLNSVLERTTYNKPVTLTLNRVQNHAEPYHNVPDEFDTLFIDTDGKSSTLQQHLTNYHNRIKRFIVIHDTFVYGDVDSTGSQGLNFVLRAFCDDNPQWKPIFYTSNEYGLTILGCREEDHPKQNVMAWKIGKGPGTELKAMNAELGIKPAENCSCNRLAAEMDFLGVDGCRQERSRIVQGLKDNSTKYKWTELLFAGIRSATCSFAGKIKISDLFGSLVDEAIRRAEESQKQ